MIGKASVPRKLLFISTFYSILMNIPPDLPDVAHSTILPAKPGIAMLWVPRTVLNLKIDSSQLSPGYEAPSSSFFVPENQTNHTKRTNLVSLKLHLQW